MAQLRQLCQHGGQVEGLDDAQMGIGGIVLLADGAAHTGADGDAACDEEGADTPGIKALFPGYFEIGGIVKEEAAIDAPHIVLVVGIVERHATLFRRRRETAAHHHGRLRR